MEPDLFHVALMKAKTWGRCDKRLEVAHEFVHLLCRSMTKNRPKEIEQHSVSVRCQTPDRGDAVLSLREGP
jgi:hypothetical protein